jgi:hypothetical protein
MRQTFAIGIGGSEAPPVQASPHRATSFTKIFSRSTDQAGL